MDHFLRKYDNGRWFNNDFCSDCTSCDLQIKNFRDHQLRAPFALKANCSPLYRGSIIPGVVKTEIRTDLVTPAFYARPIITKKSTVEGGISYFRQLKVKMPST